MAATPKIVKSTPKQVDKINKRLKKHFKKEKSPEHTIKVHGIGKK